MKSPPQNILVIDVGGTHVKFYAPGAGKPGKIFSGPAMTAAEMVAGVKQATASWQYDAVSIGYPGLVKNNRPLLKPHSLGGGNARLIGKFPPGVRPGKNSNAMRGGFRLWREPCA